MSRKKKNIRICLGVLFLFVFLSWVIPAFSPYHYRDMLGAGKDLPPTGAHLFGTDALGRDLWTRCWYGTRISLSVGAACLAINGCFGLIVGMAAGYGRRRLDNILMRTADVIASVPSLLYVILLSAVTGGRAVSIVAGLCVAGWVDMARIVRAEVIRQKHQNYVASLRLDGMRSARICTVHILPNILSPVLAALVSLLPQAIFAEAFLSFLGVGIPAPAASLGTLLYEAKSRMRYYPWEMLFPLLLLWLLVLTCLLLEHEIRTMRA